MGAEIRVHDWSATSLGPPDRWPPSLRVRLSQMLVCPTAMFLAWGPDLLCFYNDAYQPLLGYRQARAFSVQIEIASLGREWSRFYMCVS